MSIMLIVGGMLMLLAAWVSQQVLYERWREQLADIAIGESIFNSYASAHSFFELLLKNAAEKDRNDIMKEEVQHYWKGLDYLEKKLPPDLWRAAYFEDVWNPLPKKQNDVSIDQLPPEMRKNWQVSIGVDSMTSQWYQPEFKKAMLEAEATIKAVARMKERIEREKSAAQKAFWVLYVFGSAAWIAGNGLRLANESGEATEHPDVG